MSANSDRESGHVHCGMSALPPKADSCSATAHVCFGPIADNLAHLGERPAFEFCSSRSQVAEMEDRKPRWGERKLVELFLQQFLEEILRSKADCHVRIEVGSAAGWYVLRYIVDCWLIDLGIFLCPDERSSRARLGGERCDCIDQFLLKSPEVFSWPDDDARQTQVIPRYEVVFERGQLPSGRKLIGQDLCDRSVQVVQVCRSDEPLQH
jgi:hypothetical protein